MKKVVFALLVIGLLLPGAGLFASSLDYLTNQSAKWFMTPTRNAATDAADIVNFNPAGTVFLPQGWNIDVSNQTLFKWYGNSATLFPTATGAGAGISSNYDSLEQDLPTWYLPNIYVAYNMGQKGPGKLALYGQLGITAGGGNLDWEDGTAGTTFALNGLKASLAGGGLNVGDIVSQSFKASSIYYGIALGGAYSFFDDMASVSLGGRLLMPKRSFSLEAAFSSGSSLKAEYDYDAYGFTPIIAFNVRPISGLTLSARYEMETQLKFKYNEKSFGAAALSPPIVTALETGGRGVLANAGISDGTKFNQNLPHSFFLGAEYDVTKDFTVSLSGNIYLLSAASMNGTEDYFGTGFEIGVGTTYMVVENFKLGMGVFYTETGAKDSYFNSSGPILNASANPTLDSIAFGAGGTYSFKSGVDLTLSALYCHYLPFDYSVTSSSSGTDLYTVSGTYSKDVFSIGIGVGYKY